MVAIGNMCWMGDGCEKNDGKSPFCLLQVSQKSIFPPSTLKLEIAHPLSPKTSHLTHSCFPWWVFLFFFYFILAESLKNRCKS
jgi:hypothetical protein